MPDREKVIKGLREMSCRATWNDIDRIRNKFQPIINGAIDLLKEHEAVKPKCKERIGGFVAGICPTCGTALNNILNVKACGKCGQAVKWE